MAIKLFGSSSTEIKSETEKKYVGGYWNPKNDYDVEWVAQGVSKRWLIEEPNGYVMKTKNAQTLQELITIYSSMLRQISDTDAGSKSKTDRKAELNIEIIAAIRIVINYMLEKIFPSKDVGPYMNDLGFVTKGNSYLYPLNEIERMKAMRKTIAGIKQYGLEDKALGLTYWENTLEEFESLVTGRESRSGKSRVTAADKNAKKEEIIKYLKAVRRMLWSEHDENNKVTHAVWVDWVSSIFIDLQNYSQKAYECYFNVV